MVLDKDVAERSILLKNLIDDLGEDSLEDAIPIPNVSEFPAATERL